MDLPREHNGIVDVVKQFLMEFIQDPKCENIEVFKLANRNFLLLNKG